MKESNIVVKAYEAVDAHDSRGLVDLMTEDSSFRFANLPAVTGKENIYQFLEGFYKSIKDLKHSGLEYWFTDERWFVAGNVKYWRHDDSTLEVPFSVILKMEGDLIKDYLIFVDNHELYS